MATYQNGTPVPLSQSIVTQQVWYIEKKLFNITDEFRLSYDLGFGNTLTGGIYGAYYTDNDAWSLGSNALITNQPNASPIILQGVGTDGGLYNVTNSQGMVSCQRRLQHPGAGPRQQCRLLPVGRLEARPMAVRCLGPCRAHLPVATDQQPDEPAARHTVRPVGHPRQSA